MQVLTHEIVRIFSKKRVATTEKSKGQITSSSQYQCSSNDLYLINDKLLNDSQDGCMYLLEICGDGSGVKLRELDKSQDPKLLNQNPNTLFYLVAATHFNEGYTKRVSSVTAAELMKKGNSDVARVPRRELLTEQLAKMFNVPQIAEDSMIRMGMREGQDLLLKIELQDDPNHFSFKGEEAKKVLHIQFNDNLTGSADSSALNGFGRSYNYNGAHIGASYFVANRGIGVGYAKLSQISEDAYNLGMAKHEEMRTAYALLKQMDKNKDQFSIEPLKRPESTYTENNSVIFKGETVQGVEFNIEFPSLKNFMKWQATASAHTDCMAHTFLKPILFVYDKKSYDIIGLGTDRECDELAADKHRKNEGEFGIGSALVPSNITGKQVMEHTSKIMLPLPNELYQLEPERALTLKK